MRAQTARRQAGMAIAVVFLAACTVALTGAGGWRALGSADPLDAGRPGGAARRAAASQLPAPGRRVASAAPAVPPSRYPAACTGSPHARLAAPGR